MYSFSTAKPLALFSGNIAECLDSLTFEEGWELEILDLATSTQRQSAIINNSQHRARNTSRLDIRDLQAVS